MVESTSGIDSVLETEMKNSRDGGNSTPETDNQTLVEGCASEESPAVTGERIRGLARAFSSMSRASRASRPEEYTANPFDVTDDSPLNPNSANFDATYWAKTYLSALAQDTDRYPQRTAGVSYHNLHVYGFGGDTDYQKDVLNVFLHSANLVRGLFREKQKVPILKEFDGLVRPGELCVVLGRPGRYVERLYTCHICVI